MRFLAVVLVAVFLGGCADAPALAPQEAGAPVVIGRSFDIASKAMGQVRRVNVFTPPGYDPAKRYPVVYLLDGGADQDFPHIAGLAHIGALDGWMADVIVVGIETKDRRNELTFPILNDAKLKADYPTSGGSERFRRFVIDEVKPMVEARWRTSGKGVLIGESLAGLFVVETVLREPQDFDGYLAASPSLWWDNERLSKEAAGLLGQAPAATAVLYLTRGDEGEEMEAPVERVAKAIEAAPGQKMLVYKPMPQEHHNTIFHRAALWALPLLFPLPAAK